MKWRRTLLEREANLLIRWCAAAAAESERGGERGVIHSFAYPSGEMKM